MYTSKDLKQQLQQMGFAGTETVMIHSSMKSIGEVEGGAQTVIDALMEYFSEGLLLLPTHTWRQMSEEYCVFDPETEPACVGILPNLFMKRKGVVRSLHPTHSIAAYGKRAAEYIQGEENITTPCAPEGCWGRLLTEHAKILLIGVTHARNTFIHGIEEMWDVPERLTKEPVLFQIKMPDGSLKPSLVHRHYNPYTDHISEEFDKMQEGYFLTGAAKKTQFGDVACILCDAKRLYEVTGKILQKERNCFIDRKEIPQEWYLTAKIFESHAHYDDDAFEEDRDVLLSSLQEKKIEYVINVGASLKSIASTVALTKQYPFVYGAAGVHPSETAQLNEENFKWLAAQCRQPKIVAVGEIGLDYYWEEPDAEIQKYWFARQLELAREVKKPVIIHSREAAKDTYDIMRGHRADELGGVVHCYSYSVEMALDYVNMGFYIGVGGVVTFKNGKKLKDVVEAVPLERILLETDSPYLAPEPNRGKRNSSLNIPYIAQQIAAIKNVSYEEVVARTHQNAKELFHI